jgi:CBS domain-containing protein
MIVSHILGQKGPEVATVSSDASVADAVAELRAHGIGALVVSDDGSTIAGILSERDVVRALAAQGAALLEARVADVMTATVLTCGAETTINELMALMTERRIRHVPVVADGALVGIVSIGDVVKSRVHELETDAEQLAGYITHGR